MFSDDKIKVRVGQAKQTHGDKYSYDSWYDVENLTAFTKVNVRCKSCEVDWVTTVDNHVRGRGCPNCRSRISKLNKLHLKALSINRRIDKSKHYIRLAETLHSGKYTYPHVNIPFNVKTKQVITCSVHGNFEQSFYNHAVKGSDCPHCVNLKLRDRHVRSWNDAKSEINTIHPSYKVNVVEDYVNAKTKIEAECVLHGKWRTSVDSLITGHGCPACKGQSQRYLYINTVDDCEGVIKYGIAKDVEFRLATQNSKNAVKMSTFLVFKFDNYTDCRSCESDIKMVLKPVLTRSEMLDGWTETTSVLNLDKIVKIIRSYNGFRL